MRQALLIIGSIVVIAIAFTAYVFLQTPPPKGGAQFAPVAAPPPPNSENGDSQTLHQGGKVLMKSYDSRTHQLSNQFGADTYDPKPDGTIDMTNPEADFFLGAGQKLTINGETANVVDPNSAGGKLEGQSQTPSRGKMQHVILRLFKTMTDTEPQFTCWVNNLAFDNDTTTIVTQDCDIPDSGGNLVHTPADQVPVHVIGQDYDFDGRGLTIKWNERDRHLERLEIAHGEQLVIKHPNSMNADEKKKSGSPTLSPQIPSPATLSPATLPSAQYPHPNPGDAAMAALSDANGPIALVSADPNDATSVLPAPAAPTSRPTKPRKKKRPATKPIPPPTSAPVIHRAKDPGVYRATFFDNVHITQADQTIGTADRMNVDFFMNGGHSTTEPSTQPTTQLAAVGDAASSDVTSLEAPEPRPVHEHKHPPIAAEGEDATSPSTQPDVPVIVHWTGRLVLTPPDADVPPLAIGDSVLEMIGEAAPVVLNRTGSIIHAASFRYHTIDQSVELNNSQNLPIVDVLDANGTKVYAPSVLYDGIQHTATIAGPARAEFPVAGDNRAPQPSTRPTQIAKADWSDSCTLKLQPDDHGGQQVTEALLDGDVHVDHPQVKMLADELDLGLDNSPRPKADPAPAQNANGDVANGTTSSGQLRSMDASGAVDCTLIDSQGKSQRIQADHLTLDTHRQPDGTDVPSVVIADGKVHTSDATQSLRSEHLIANLEPAARSSASTATKADKGPFGGDVQLHDLTATDDVHFTATDGSFADADRLTITTLKPAAPPAPADQDIELIGQPSARVGDKLNVLTGPIIHYNPVTKQAHVIGAGTMHAVQQVVAATPHAQPTSRPMDVDWQTGFAMDGISNRAEISGDVHTRSVSADGTVNSAIGDKVKITLIDAPPTTAPTTSPAPNSATAPATAPSTLVKGGDTNFMKDKQIDTITLIGKGDENIEVNSVALDQAGHILHSMNLFAPTATYDKTIDTFRVDTPGRMLVRDFRASSAATSPPSTDPSAGGMHGISAFQWQKSFVFDQRADEAVMTGDVQVVHNAAGSASYQMFADKITADLDPNSHPTTAASTSTSKPSIPTGEDSMRVKRLVATGQVRMISQRLQFLAAEAVYDPQTQIMIAHGSQREPAELLDEQGLSTGNFDELIYNTKTDQVQIKEFQGNMRK